MKKLCIECHKRPIFNRKRQLCQKCYNRLRYKAALPVIEVESSYHKTLKDAFKREIEFVKNFFNHNNWIHHPVMFNLNDEKYSPDFYDSNLNVFIEVSGTRQAYHANKHKYDLFRELYPKLNLEIRKPTEEFLNEESRDKHW